MEEEEEYERAINELFSAAQVGLQWIPTRTHVIDGGANPAHVRLKAALELFAAAQQRRFLKSKLQT